MDFSVMVKLMYAVQVLHSIEELSSGFHKKWFYRKLSWRFFLTFEILHNLFWAAVILTPSMPYGNLLMAVFALLMFANGIEHVVWYMWKKSYVPGLATAPLHIALFVAWFIANAVQNGVK